MRSMFQKAFIAILCCLTSVLATPLWADDGLDPEDAKRPVTEHPDPEKVSSSNELDALDVIAPTQSVVNRIGTDEEEFVGLDLDQDGMINSSEGTAEGELKRRWIIIDKNEDNSVDRAEFKLYYTQRYGSATETRPLTNLNNDERKKRFMEMDKDGNGELNADEFYGSMN